MTSDLFTRRFPGVTASTISWVATYYQTGRRGANWVDKRTSLRGVGGKPLWQPFYLLLVQIT